MFTIAGGVILGGIGFLLLLAVLPWISAVLQAILYMVVGLLKQIWRGLAFVAKHPLRSFVGLVVLCNPLVLIAHLAAKERTPKP